MTRFLLIAALCVPAFASTNAAAAAPTAIKANKRKQKNAVMPHFTTWDGKDLLAAPDRSRVVEYDQRGRLTVVITDTADHFVYGLLLPRDGSPGQVCTRGVPSRSGGAGGAGKCKFDLKLSGETAVIQILAVPKSGRAAADDEPRPPIYGPVIVVKPKG
jgi:hypothetical protein